MNILFELLILSEAKKNFDKMETEVRNEDEFLKFIEQHKPSLEKFAHKCANEEYADVDADDSDRGSDASGNVAGDVGEKGLTDYLVSNGFNVSEIKAWIMSDEYEKFFNDYYCDSETHENLHDIGYEVSGHYGYSGK